MASEVPAKIGIDGKEYEVSKFSDSVKSLIATHAKWREELIEARLLAAKAEYAIRALEAEISELVKKEIAAAAALLKAEESEAAPAEATTVGA